MRVALYSGGKDSVYAALREWPVDLFLFLVYQFPRPSPHHVNMAFAIELGSRMAPVVVARLDRGREFDQKAQLLRRLGATELVAGDVYVEEHLKYMERLADAVGARLREPLWGMDTEELVRREVEELSFLVVGSARGEVLCRTVDRDNVDRFIAEVKGLGMDPAGERGEYHSQVVSVPRLGASISPACGPVRDYGGYRIVELWRP